MCKQQNEWVSGDGEVINIDRAWAKSDKVLAENRLQADLMQACAVSGDRRWYALRTGRANEIDLRDQLIGEGVDAVVPVKQAQQRARRPGARGRVIHKPVLRTLVFVNVVPSGACFAGLLRLRDVAAIIGADGSPYPIRDRDMSVFMDLAQAGAFDERNTPTGLKVGSRVKINVGPYADFAGVLEGYARGRTARVQTWLFGREMTVDVKLAHLQKLD